MYIKALKQVIGMNLILNASHLFCMINLGWIKKGFPVRCNQTVLLPHLKKSMYWIED